MPANPIAATGGLETVIGLGRRDSSWPVLRLYANTAL